ncbi:MocR-like pyridoxine biosynthesis transcription factor PdxR [Pyxidicoccus xibeiensis]|uniref:MocR-like pyridoxine biosynthesis transcription factor PdxR n=1 Tax=Pyxidicoccus xibeiensis TaxID=2906759 RepID=UPI0020A7E426|nr:PLP-dependent aminotransferase family protein [Pyxidicoccus xibeiensis]MCP3135903.1 PLP-dependent aminotransferase family protein [Pyxidicoccus xibeiensis]
MPKRAAGVSLPFLQPETGAGASLHRQLYERLRESILSGALAPRSRLPSTRTLSRELGVSRGTVESAFAQLDAEGFLERRVGSGSIVALPEHARLPRTASMAPVRRGGSVARPDLLRRGGSEARPGPLHRGGSETNPDLLRRGSSPARLGLSRRGRVLAREVLPPEPRDVQPFTPCLPALDLFPTRLWARAVAKQTRLLGPGLMTAGEPAGFRPLREALAAHLGTSRGVRCEWRQVLVLSSTQQALDLVARLLLDEGDAVWLEEPGYLGARAAFESAGARVHAVPVDAEGLRVDVGTRRAPRARLAYVTPSHQYPLGVTLSLSRRLALLEWARAASAWVLEDDYDSEFRYATRPLAAIQGLDVAGRVLYAGTFNKVMFPSLRLAFLVVPERLVDAFTAARAATDGHAPVLSQAAMAHFMEAGHYAAHLRQMRLAYAERRDALLDALRRETEGWLRPGAADAGMHVTAFLGRGARDADVVRRADAKGLGARGLSPLYLGRNAEQGLVLGFSGASPAGLRAAVRALTRLLAPGAPA